MPPAAPPFFCFTLDTEPDGLWEPFAGLQFGHFGRLWEFHRGLADRGCRPTYLTTSEVAEDPKAAAVMGRVLETGEAELGAHFHTWTRAWPFPVPPLGDPPQQAMAHQLGQETECRMLGYTCAALEKAFGVRPRSYRGGRWSYNAGTTRSLRDNGILVDTTVVPGKSYRDAAGPLVDGPDFRGVADSRPFYRRVGSDAPDPAGGDVLELPVGAYEYPLPAVARANRLVGKVVRRAAGLVGRPVGWTWLRPTYQTRAQLSACLAGLHRSGAPVWVAMIHSSEIVPCRWLPTQPQVEAFVARCYRLVEEARALGATCATLDEVRRHYGHGV